jgi:hypothetical protein
VTETLSTFPCQRVLILCHVSVDKAQGLCKILSFKQQLQQKLLSSKVVYVEGFGLPKLIPCLANNAVRECQNV